MSHKNKQTLTPLIDKMKRELHAMAAFGQSKHADKLAEKADGLPHGSLTSTKIYSFSTMKTYQRHLIAFLRDTQKKHKEVRSLTDCEKYIPEWIAGRIGQYSPFTVKMELSALAKLYHKKSSDYSVTIPRRLRQNIVRSRGKAARDTNFSDVNNRELLALATVSGMRRREISRLKPEWLEERDGHFFIHVTDGAKGGRPRTIPLMENEPEALKIALHKIRSTPPGKRVFPHINTSVDIHHYRHLYVQRLYQTLARPANAFRHERMIFRHGKHVFTYQSPTCHAAPEMASEYYETVGGQLRLKEGYTDVSSCYFCRGADRQPGQILDRAAMQLCSEAVGHSRIGVTAIYLTSGTQ